MEMNAKHFDPLRDRVLLRQQESSHETASGIVIPDAASEKPDQGEVMAVGAGDIMQDGKVRLVDVKVGDAVLFGKYAGQTVKVGGEELVVMREQDIVAIL